MENTSHIIDTEMIVPPAILMNNSLGKIKKDRLLKEKSGKIGENSANMRQKLVRRQKMRPSKSCLTMNTGTKSESTGVKREQLNEKNAGKTRGANCGNSTRNASKIKLTTAWIFNVNHLVSISLRLRDRTTDSTRINTGATALSLNLALNLAIWIEMKRTLQVFMIKIYKWIILLMKPVSMITSMHLSS